MNGEPSARHYAAIFSVSLAILVLEVALARVLSVALLSHYAFVAVSLAMFGIGLSALLVYLLPQRFPAARVDRQVVTSTWLFGLTAAASMVVFLHVHVVQQLSLGGFASLGFVYAVLAIPFFFAGLAVSLLMTHFSAAMSRLYGADLLGAACGCAVVVAAMSLVPAPVVAVLVAWLTSLAALALAWRGGARARMAPAIAVLVALGLTLSAQQTRLFTMRYVKAFEAADGQYEAWNAFSRVSVFETTADAGEALGLSDDGGPYPETLMIDIDGTAWTPLTHYDGNVTSLSYLRDSVLYSAHHLRPDANVLVIGTGGGRDLLAAHAFGQHSVLGVEINPLMGGVTEKAFGDYAGHPYSQAGATVVFDEARSYLASITQRFDLIQLSLIDTFSLNAAGGVVFSENYLYTTEAFREYYRHLAPGGVLTVSRYFAARYPLELLRVLGMARAAWEAEGVHDFAAHVAVLSQGVNGTVLIGRDPLSAADIARLAELAADKGFGVQLLPNATASHAEMQEIVSSPDLPTLFAFHPFLLAPPTDDQPFFFHFLRGRLAELPGPGDDPFQILRQWNDAQVLMYLLVGVVGTLAALFFIAPLLLLRRGAVTRLPAAITVPLLLYFGCLGYGFMMLEIPLMQRFILFLGYPVYALVVILFALLLFSGLGALWSRDVAATSLRRVLIGIVLLSALYVWGLPPLIAMLMALPIAAKIALTVACLAPLGLLLGMAYPLGIGILRRAGTELVPWAWGLNGAMSVVASVLATFIGSRFGFSTAMLTGAAAYALALVCIGVVGRRLA
ncbi:MAG: hypothetical protein ABI629_04710 [bacterium]